MTSDSFEALGTKWWIEIFDNVSKENSQAAISRLAVFSKTFNDRYSRFKEDSQISILNRERRLEKPSNELQQLLTYGKQLYLRTNGQFNFLVGHILEARGYDKDYSFTPTDKVGAICNPVTDIEILDSEITLNCGNVDLGGFGKGYLIDLMADLLKKQGLNYFLINGGGDMYATSDNGAPITIYLEHPLTPDTYLEETSLFNQGFAASSPFKRQWKHGNVTYNHIVAKNAPEPVASFVKAASAAEADAFATTALLLSENELEELASRENFSLARYNPKTAELWRIRSF